jgi:hypothetical protein
VPGEKHKTLSKQKKKKKKLKKQKVLEAWFRWQRVCLTVQGPEFKLQYHKKIHLKLLIVKKGKFVLIVYHPW